MSAYCKDTLVAPKAIPQCPRRASAFPFNPDLIFATHDPAVQVAGALGPIPYGVYAFRAVGYGIELNLTSPVLQREMCLPPAGKEVVSEERGRVLGTQALATASRLKGGM